MRTALLPLLVVLTTLLLALPSSAVNKQGIIHFPIPKDVSYPVSMQGSFMTLEGQMWSEAGGLGGGQHIHFQGTVKNTSRATAFYSIYMSVFDKKWTLIGANGLTQVFGTDPGKSNNQSFDIYIPQSEIPKIDIYQITFYDDAAGIGKQ